MRPGLLTAIAGSLLLAACATSMPALREHRETVREFSLEARFALRVAMPGSPVSNSSGRLSWTHSGENDRVLLANPLGIGLAEIEVTPQLSRLKTADGRNLESNDPDALMEEVTGQRLPVRRFPAWLLGKAENGTGLEKDAGGRPARLREAGWQIDYAYADDAPGALPNGLKLSRDKEIELRLRVEDWKEAP